MRKIFSSIDVGSSSIKIVVCELFENKLNVLASTNYQSMGIKQGMVVDDNLVKETLKKAINEVNSSLGLKIDKAIINVPMYESEYMINDGTITITNDDMVVTGNDMVNALQTSIYNKISKTRELVTIQPIKYRVDTIDQDILKPRGIRANKLSVTSMCMTVPKKNIYKIISILQELNIEVIDILFGIIGDYFIFKNEEISSKITGVINIGSDKIETAVFKNGIIYNSKVVTSGANIIDNDISYIYNIQTKEAKKIKELFALAHKDFASSSDIYEIINKSGIKTKINQAEVSEICMGKLKELLEIAKKSLNDLTKKEISYIIVTGGLTELKDFSIILEKVIGKSAYLGDVKNIGARDNNYASTLGILKYYKDRLDLRGKAFSMFTSSEIEEMNDKGKRVSDNKESIFGKVFGYFFES